MPVSVFELGTTHTTGTFSNTLCTVTLRRYEVANTIDSRNTYENGTQCVSYESAWERSCSCTYYGFKFLQC